MCIRDRKWTVSASFDWRKGGQFVSQTYRYGESDLHSQRWIDKTVKINNVADMPAYLKAHADEYLSPCLLYTSPSPRDRTRSRMPSSA